MRTNGVRTEQICLTSHHLLIWGVTLTPPMLDVQCSWVGVSVRMGAWSVTALRALTFDLCVNWGLLIIRALRIRKKKICGFSVVTVQKLASVTRVPLRSAHIHKVTCIPRWQLIFSCSTLLPPYFSEFSVEQVNSPTPLGRLCSSSTNRVVYRTPVPVTCHFTKV
jgi:hypothetical protein